MIEWNDDFLLGNRTIDDEHKMLFRIINRLVAMKDDKNRAAWACRESVKFFKDHAVRHFADEEEYMEKMGYPHLEHHKQLHDHFCNETLPLLAEEVDRQSYSADSIDHFVGVCAGWLISHTVTEDLAIVGKGSTTARVALTGQQLQPLEEIMLDYMHDMFDMHGRVVTRNYSGERFGHGIYYRLAYRVDDSDLKEEVYLVFEESTLINSVGLVLGVDKIDNGLMHATRYMARQLVEFMHQHGGFNHKYELADESLLSYNDFRDYLKDQKPQASILFDSGGGYVAFCLVAPHKVQVDAGQHLEPATETRDMSKLMEARTDRKQRQKILVVDDSATVLENMRALLRDDYEVSVAKSGASAIRAMTLNLPDLVLLDYDMPLLDGKQMLQMIRAEEEFAKTPVVFLTGATDTPTVKKLLDMRPFGMLLKSMPNETLKQKIDALAEKVPAQA